MSFIRKCAWPAEISHRLGHRCNDFQLETGFVLLRKLECSYFCFDHEPTHLLSTQTVSHKPTIPFTFERLRIILLAQFGVSLSRVELVAAIDVVCLHCLQNRDSHNLNPAQPRLLKLDLVCSRGESSNIRPNPRRSHCARTSDLNCKHRTLQTHGDEENTEHDGKSESFVLLWTREEMRWSDTETNYMCQRPYKLTNTPKALHNGETFNFSSTR